MVEQIRAYRTIQTAGLLLCALLIVPPAYAERLGDFKARFSVEAMGMTLGQAKHRFHCDGENCTLTSEAKPSGLAALFFSDSSFETVQLKQSENRLQWLKYHKIGFSEKEGENQEKHTTLSVDSSHEKIVYHEKSRHWDYQAKAFDSLSLAYAIQHAHLNGLSMDDFILQDNNYQDTLTLKSVNRDAVLALSFAESDLDAVKYHFTSEHTDIELWLLPELSGFPGKIRVLNDNDKTITFSLAEPPEIP